jgi:hypothetical protein
MNKSEVSIKEYNELERNYLLALLKIDELERENERLLDDIRALITEEASAYDPDWVVK